MTSSPRPCLFDLSREAEESRLVADASRVVCLYLETVAAPIEWHRHSGLVRVIVDKGEVYEDELSATYR